MKQTTVDDYIHSFPQETQEKLQVIKKVIREEVPQGEETISYGIPTVKLNGKYVVYFAGYKNHLSLHPVFAAMEKSLPEIAKYRSGKGTIQFPLDKPLPIDLIRKIVKIMLQENIAKTAKNKS